MFNDRIIIAFNTLWVTLSAVLLIATNLPWWGSLLISLAVTITMFFFLHTIRDIISWYRMKPVRFDEEGNQI